MTDDRKLLNNMKSVAILPLLTTLFTYAKRWNILCSTFVQCAAALNHRRHHHQTARCLHERCVLYGMRHGTTFGVQRFAFRLMKYGSLSIFSVFPIFWFCFAPWTSCLPSYPNPILVITIDVCTFLYIDVQQTHTQILRSSNYFWFTARECLHWNETQVICHLFAARQKSVEMAHATRLVSICKLSARIRHAGARERERVEYASRRLFQICVSTY